MSIQHSLKFDHINSVLFSVCVNGVLLLALFFLVDLSSASSSSPEYTYTIIPEEPPVEIEEPEPLPEESVVDEPEDLSSLSLHMSDFQMEEPALEDPVQESEVVPNNHLMIDVASPVTLSGAMAGIPTGGGGGGFGRKEGGAYDLVGTMIDLKRNSKGRPRSMDYSADIGRMVESGFSKTVMREFMILPRKLHLSHLFVPYTQASAGPEAFGVADLMQPRGWMVHYQGWIKAPLPGQYRFVGEFDDIIVVMIDGKVVMESNWGIPATPWSPTYAVDKHQGFTRQPLVYGDWIPFDGRPHKIDLLVGEHPGGLVGGLLMIQEKDRTYRKARNGRSILPPFTLRPLHAEHVKKMNSVGHFPMETKYVPVFGVNTRASNLPDEKEEDPVSFQIL